MGGYRPYHFGKNVKKKGNVKEKRERQIKGKWKAKW
jgi:hypothetical protein